MFFKCLLYFTTTLVIFVNCGYSQTVSIDEPADKIAISYNGGGGGNGTGHGGGNGGRRKILEAQNTSGRVISEEIDSTKVRVAVIGGMVMTGMWQHVSKMFTERTGLEVELIASGERPYLADALRAGKVDLLTMHSGDITTNLVSDGYGMDMAPWTRNNLVIIGPEDDPAGIEGFTSGAKALEKIVQANCFLIDNRGIGARETLHNLLHYTSIKAYGPWVLQDTIDRHSYPPLQFALENNAYLIFGKMPIVCGKQNSEGMKIFVSEDPAMMRSYIVMLSNPAYNKSANVTGARKLQLFLLSDQVQSYLANDPSNQYSDEVPFFFPVGQPIDQIMPGYLN